MRVKDFMITVLVYLVVAFILRLVLPMIPVIGVISQLVDPVFGILVLIALWTYIIEPIMPRGS